MKRWGRNSKSLCLAIFWNFFSLVAQAQDPFISKELNRILIPGDSGAFRRLFHKMDSLVRFGKGQINIVHIGGSHVQADIYSHRIRQRLRSYFPGFEGARGFVFPFAVAGTNNPSNYKVEYGGRWTTCRNVSATPCLLGLSGISITTRDTSAWIRIIPGSDPTAGYRFNRVRLFHPVDTSVMHIDVGVPEVIDFEWINPELGFTEYHIRKHLDTLIFYVSPGPRCGHSFTLFGVQFLNEDPGIVYHSLGVNGAATSSFLLCGLFVPHLKALKPDLVIFSLGVNDAHGPSFSKESFKENYRQLVSWVRQAQKDAAVLFITNNDTYLRRRYPNERHPEARDGMMEVAQECGGGVWNLYDIMGGRGSIVRWHAAGLAQSDLVHFTREGYTRIGDALFEAFIRLWSTFNRRSAR